MKIISHEPFSQNGFFILQDQSYLNNHRIAGRIAAETLHYLEQLIVSKTSYSMIDLNNIAEEMIVHEDAYPTFKGYNGFPASICISINEKVVHGIPTNYKLKDGDVVSIDLGVTYKDAIADTALTCIFGNPKYEWHNRLISATKEALYKGISSIHVGNKLGVIGNAIYKSAKGNGFSVIEKYGGHGIGKDFDEKPVLHASPFVANKSNINEGIRIQPGMVLALEPMLVLGDISTHIAEDNWTVIANSICAHEEHTVYVHPNHVEIITDRSKL